jgi:hypothetical protein
VLARDRRDSPTPRDSSRILPCRPGCSCARIASLTRSRGYRVPAKGTTAAANRSQSSHESAALPWFLLAHVQHNLLATV